MVWLESVLWKRMAKDEWNRRGQGQTLKVFHLCAEMSRLYLGLAGGWGQPKLAGEVTDTILVWKDNSADGERVDCNGESQ